MRGGNEATTKRGAKTSTVITVVAAVAARTSDVWHGRIALAEGTGGCRVTTGGESVGGARGGRGGGRDTWARGDSDGWFRGFRLYSSRFVYLSAMDPASRLQRTTNSYPGPL